MYGEATVRMDAMDQTKAEKEWIDDLMAKIRRQVGALKKQLSSEDEGRLSQIHGTLNDRASPPAATSRDPTCFVSTKLVGCTCVRTCAQIDTS